MDRVLKHWHLHRVYVLGSTPLLLHMGMQMDNGMTLELRESFDFFHA